MAVASYSIKPSNSKYTNWIEACLAVLITKEGIEPFVYDEIKLFQQKKLADICYTNLIPSGTVCSSCCTENVVVCPRDRSCNVGRGRCSYHRNVSSLYLPAGCPNQICHNLKTEIQNAHRYYGPSYKNTDATQWCTNPWEVAKCFMPPDGYKDVTSPAETDFNGIISVILNYKDFQAKISDNLSKKSNVFEKGRNIGKAVRHSPSLEVEDADLQQYFTDLQNLLSDPKLLASSKDVQNASRKLSQLQNDTLVIDLKNFRQMLKDVAKDVRQDINEEKDDLKKDVKSRKLELIEAMEDSVKTIGAAGKTSLSQINDAMKTAIDRIQSETAESLKSIETKSITAALNIKDESNKGVEKIIAERKTGTELNKKDTEKGIVKLKRKAVDERKTGRKLLLKRVEKKGLEKFKTEADAERKTGTKRLQEDVEKGIKRLKTEADTELKTGIRLIQEDVEKGIKKLKTEADTERKTGMRLIQGGVAKDIEKFKTEEDVGVKHIQLSTGESIQRIERTFSTNNDQAENAKYNKLKKDEWDHCLDTEDDALLKDLIYRDRLPDGKQLDRACLVFSRSSMIIGLITDKICQSLKQKYADKVRRVWAAYEPCMDNHIVFVIITKEEEDDACIVIKPDYDLRFRRECDFNSESLEVILEENDQDLFPEECEMLKVQTCIKETTSTLMNKHSNLTLISASILKCKGYGTDMCTTERKPCIVLHVHVKGLIPLRESVFPRHLGDIDTDVREGCVLLHCGKGPNEKHPNVKMGCGIKAKNQDACGTLGGFIDHPEYGLCALTCAHAMIDDIEPSEILRKEFKNERVECVQPSFEIDNPEGSRFGILKLIAMREGTSKGIAGFDYALIAVEKDRIPLDGSFPFVDKEELTNAGFHDPPSFATGETIDFKKLIGKRTRCSVVKYGSTTVLTCGMLKWLDPTVSFKDQSSKITLLNQIQVNLTRTEGKKCFSAGGDSGALVFKVDDSSKLIAVGLLVAGNAKLGFSVVTPICDILEDIKIQKLKPFNDPVETNNDNQNENVCRYY